MFPITAKTRDEQIPTVFVQDHNYEEKDNPQLTSHS